MIDGKMDEVLGKFCVPLEGRFALIRRQECNLGNWVCDVLLAATAADVLLLNSGTFRSDQVRPKYGSIFRNLWRRYVSVFFIFFILRFIIIKYLDLLK